MRSQEPEREVLAHVGANVRRLRLAASLSQGALAASSGLSRRMIVNVEGGDANISLANLGRLAAALGVSFGEIMRPPGQPDGRRVASVGWQGEHPGSRGVMLGEVPAAHSAELWLWTMGPGEHYAATPDPTSWHEMIFVMEGELIIDLPGGPHQVEAGDFLIFGTDQPYGYRNEGETIVRFTRNVVS